MLGSTADDIGVFPEMKEKASTAASIKGCINWSIALENSEEKPVYVYYFTRALLGDDAERSIPPNSGTCSEPGPKLAPETEGDYALSKEMMDDWTNFMKPKPERRGKRRLKPCTRTTNMCRCWM